MLVNKGQYFQTTGINQGSSDGCLKAQLKKNHSL